MAYTSLQIGRFKNWQQVPPLNTLLTNCSTNLTLYKENTPANQGRINNYYLPDTFLANPDVLARTSSRMMNPTFVVPSSTHSLRNSSLTPISCGGMKIIERIDG